MLKSVRLAIRLLIISTNHPETIFVSQQMYVNFLQYILEKPNDCEMVRGVLFFEINKISTSEQQITNVYRHLFAELYRPVRGQLQ